MSARRRTRRDGRRRRLGQNFLRPDLAERFVAESGVGPDELVVEIGPGTGAITLALARRRARVVAVEADPVWAARLARRWRSPRGDQDPRDGPVRVIAADFLAWPLPAEPFRVVASLPFGHTTAILDRLLADPSGPLLRADLIVQWEVAAKRAASPPATLRSTQWAPWWCFRLGRRLDARAFRPVPRVDGGVLQVTRRDPALLPPALAPSYARFVRSHWPPGASARRPTARSTPASTSTPSPSPTAGG